MKIVIFSAIQNNGGIQQFAFQCLRTCLNKGWEAYILIPDNENIIIPDDVLLNTIRYRKQKDILGITPEMFKVARTINRLNPDYMFITDDCMYSIQVMRWVRRKVKKILTVHDVTPHPGRKESLPRKILNFISMVYYRREGFLHAKNILVLSENSRNRFKIRYPFFYPKLRIMNLGAHPPKCANKQKPKEFATPINRFFLYFGRIERYKGIYTLLKAFNNIGIEGVTLVVAGNGTFTSEEQIEISNGKNIITINRYILDEEMTWLMENALAVVAPYIEASQSGVLPLAYHFGKPVVVSSVEGLKEMVFHGETGYIFNSIKELEDILISLSFKDQTFYDNMRNNCLCYEAEYLNWNNNISHIIQ